MGQGHPERPERMRAVERALESEAFQMLARDVAPRADLAAIARNRSGRSGWPSPISCARQAG